MLVQLLRNLLKLVCVFMFLVSLIAFGGWIISIVRPPLPSFWLYQIYNYLFPLCFVLGAVIIISPPFLASLADRWMGTNNFADLAYADLNTDKRWKWFRFLVFGSEIILGLVSHNRPIPVILIDDHWAFPSRMSDKLIAITELEARQAMWNSLRFCSVLLVSCGSWYARLVYLFLKWTRGVR